MRLKKILKYFHLSTDNINLRVMKEHAKETRNEKIDMTPALIQIK